MAESILRFKHNWESVAFLKIFFENSIPIESSNKPTRSEDHMRRRMEKKHQLKYEIIENYKKRLVAIEMNYSYSIEY